MSIDAFLAAAVGVRTDAVPATLSAVERYFDAWRTHDAAALRVLFAPEAHYRIRPRGRVLAGLEAITAYWRRNAARQRRLRVRWCPTEIRVDEDATAPAELRVAFAARFLDCVEHEAQRVSGTIRFRITTQGVITDLDETYRKTARRVPARLAAGAAGGPCVSSRV